MPRDLPRQLYDLLWRQEKPAVLTSGTLAAGGFAPARRQLGLEGGTPVRTLQVPSPFDYPHNSLLVAFGIAVVFAAIVQRHRAPNYVVVDVAGVEMGRHHGLVPPGQQLVGQFHADLVRQFRRDFAFGKTLDQMVPLYAAGFVPAVGVGFHVGKRCFAQATQSRLKADGLGLVTIEGVIHRFFQRTRLCGFSFISHIFHRPVQAAHGDEGCIGRCLSPFQRKSRTRTGPATMWSYKAKKRKISSLRIALSVVQHTTGCIQADLPAIAMF